VTNHSNGSEPVALARGLGWPEGPATLADGAIVFVESYASQITVWTPERGCERYAYTAGAPNSCVVGADDAIYVCQNGGTVGAWRAPEQTVASIQRITDRGGTPEILVTEVEGIPLRGPNDLVFAPDGTLYFTDPGTYNPEDPDPSYIFALHANGRSEVVVEFPQPVFPNGLAVQDDGAIVWDESYTGHVRRTRGTRGALEELGRLPGDNPIPDGMKLGEDGRLYVTDLVAGGIHVLSPAGAAEGFIPVGAAPTNCLFAGDSLIVTDAGRLADSAEASFNGALWRIPLGRTGQPVARGASIEAGLA
jgi:gluconolactonase